MGNVGAQNLGLGDSSRKPRQNRADHLLRGNGLSLMNTDKQSSMKANELKIMQPDTIQRSNVALKLSQTNPLDDLNIVPVDLKNQNMNAVNSRHQPNSGVNNQNSKGHVKKSPAHQERFL